MRAVYETAAEHMRSGANEHATIAMLVNQGFDSDSATAVVSNLEQLHSDALREVARKNMRQGVLWCVGGLVVTALTYSAASLGGQYVVAWGAVVFGGVQFLRGLTQAVRA